MRLIPRLLISMTVLAGLIFFPALAVHAQVLGEVTANKVNVRDAGSLTGSNVLYTVNTGQPLEITGVEGDYYQINLGTDTGVYIASEYVRITHDDSLSIRSEPAASEAQPSGEGTPGETLAEVNAEQTPLADAVSANAEDTAVLADQIIDYAKEFIGTTYRYGGSNPESGFDCSGFVSYVLEHFDVSVERSSGDMAAQGVTVDRGALQKGDLLFFATAGGRSISHVGIYIGDQRLIHATDWGGGVEISDLNEEYYVESYVKATRVL